MSIPDFFIIGAPKCGTTAMYEYLRQHPAIFMPRLKEPHYFSTDLPNIASIKSEADYLKLFEKQAPHHALCGEASVFYLCSTVAIQKIMAVNPAAKFLAMVRNPLEMVPSLHSEYLFNFFEQENDCEIAWRLQGARSSGQQIPDRCSESRLLQYAEVCSLGTQVARLASQVPATQWKVIVFDDFKCSPRAAYEDVLSFLNVSTDSRQAFPVCNERKSHRNRWIGRFLQTPPAFLRGIREHVKRSHYIDGSLMGKLSFRLLQWSRRSNSRADRPFSLASEFLLELSRYFSDDVHLLSCLLGRKLDHWLKHQ